MKNVYSIVSLVVYILCIAVAIALLLSEPQWFDAKAAILPLVVVLFLSSNGVAYSIAFTDHRAWMTTVGTITLALLLTFVGFLMVAGVSWVYVLGKAA